MTVWDAKHWIFWTAQLQDWDAQGDCLKSFWKGTSCNFFLTLGTLRPFCKHPTAKLPVGLARLPGDSSAVAMKIVSEVDCHPKLLSCWGPFSGELCIPSLHILFLLSPVESGTFFTFGFFAVIWSWSCYLNGAKMLQWGKGIYILCEPWLNAWDSSLSFAGLSFLCGPSKWISIPLVMPQIPKICGCDISGTNLCCFIAADVC